MERASTVEQAVKILNEALKADPAAVNSLFNNRVACNGNLAKHKTIQVAQSGGPLCNGSYELGVIEIINGLFGVDDTNGGAIAAQYGLKCGCDEVPDGGQYGFRCEVCDCKIDLGDIIQFVDNGRKVNHPSDEKEEAGYTHECALCGRPILTRTAPGVDGSMLVPHKHKTYEGGLCGGHLVRARKI